MTGTTAIDLPGPESAFLGDLARDLDCYIIAQAKVTHPEFAERFFNCAFAIDPAGEERDRCWCRSRDRLGGRAPRG